MFATRPICKLLPRCIGEVEDGTDLGYGVHLDQDCAGPTFTSSNLLGLIIESSYRNQYRPEVLMPDSIPRILAAGGTTYYQYFKCDNPGFLGHCNTGDTGIWECRANAPLENAVTYYEPRQNDESVTGLQTQP